MSLVDLDRLKKTARLQVIGPKKNFVSRLEIAETLQGSIALSEVTAIFKQEQSDVWFISFDDSHCVDDLVRLRMVESERFNLHMSSCAARRISLKVHWLPVWLNDDPVVDFFESFGKVITYSRDTFEIADCGIETGIRTVDLIIQEGDQYKIPYRCSIGNRSCLITMKGRPPLCLKCGNIGHVRSSCTVNLTPRHTNRSSYANVVSKESSEGAGPQIPSDTCQGDNSSTPATNLETLTTPTPVCEAFHCSC